MTADAIPDEVHLPQVFVGEIEGVKLRWSAISDPGKVRTTNEDGAMTSMGVYLLADGMGGHEGGEIASAVTLASMNSLSVIEYAQTLNQFAQSISMAVFDIDKIESKTGRQAGTTLTGAILTYIKGKAHWLIVNIGDSRTYLLRNNELQQLTVDHSQVQELIDSGHLSVEQAKVDVRRNVITRALGAGMDPEVEYWVYPVSEGDYLLICSDGLTNEVEDSLLSTVLQESDNPGIAVQTLVSMALDAGARDNVTLIVVEVEKIDPAVVYVSPDPEDDTVIHGELVFSRDNHGRLHLYDPYD